MTQLEKVSVHRENSHHRRPRRRGPQLGRPTRRQALVPRDLGRAAPIQSNCSPPAGRPASSARSGVAAAQRKVALPADRAIDAEVDLGTN